MRRTASAALVAVVALLLGSKEASADEEATRPRYPPSSVRPKLMAGGLLVTGIAYGGAALTSALSSGWPDTSELLIPIAGPWMALSKTACPTTEPDCGATLYIRGILVALDGLMQIGGVGIVAEGLFMKTESSPTPTKTAQARWIRPVPIVTSTATGFGLVGTF